MTHLPTNRWNVKSIFDLFDVDDDKTLDVDEMVSSTNLFLPGEKEREKNARIFTLEAVPQCRWLLRVQYKYMLEMRYMHSSVVIADVQHPSILLPILHSSLPSSPHSTSIFLFLNLTSSPFHFPLLRIPHPRLRASHLPRLLGPCVHAAHSVDTALKSNGVV